MPAPAAGGGKLRPYAFAATGGGKLYPYAFAATGGGKLYPYMLLRYWPPTS